MAKYLDETGAEQLNQLLAAKFNTKADKTEIPTKTSELTNDSGFGTYSKPTGGIPKTDLASDVQTSLEKADTALQSYAETDPTVPAAVKAITSTDISNWNAKGTYSKPSDGIPKSDLSMSVQTSLEAADTAVQGPDILDVERTGNKVTSISSSSSNRQYPTAKLLYDQLQLKQDKLTAGTNITINNNTISATDTKNTAGATDSSSKLYLIGATSQAANPQTYSDDQVYVQDGSLIIGSKGSGTIGTNSFAQGYIVTASGQCAHAEGRMTTASGSTAHSEGSSTKASGDYAHAEGYYATASGDKSHAEGSDTAALDNGSHVEGAGGIASGVASHAEGTNTGALDTSSHAEGYNTAALGRYSHAEGIGAGYSETKIILTGDANATTYTTNDTSNVKIGYYINKSSSKSIATGGAFITAITTNSSITLNRTLSASAVSNKEYTIFPSVIASGWSSHAEGANTIAQTQSQHAQGEYNIPDASGTTSQRGAYAHIVGNGTSNTNRSNAHTLAWDGTAWFQGDVYVGSTSGTNKDSGSKKLATEDYVTTRGYITTDTKNTAGSTDTSNKIYLVGATSQAANPRTYSDNEVYTTSGTLTAKEFSLGTNAKIVYNTSESCIEFNFS